VFVGSSVEDDVQWQRRRRCRPGRDITNCQLLGAESLWSGVRELSGPWQRSAAQLLLRILNGGRGPGVNTRYCILDARIVTPTNSPGDQESLLAAALVRRVPRLPELLRRTQCLGTGGKQDKPTTTRDLVCVVKRAAKGAHCSHQLERWLV
jgi:hypothetical protein